MNLFIKEAMEMDESDRQSNVDAELAVEIYDSNILIVKCGIHTALQGMIIEPTYRVFVMEKLWIKFAKKEIK